MIRLAPTLSISLIILHGCAHAIDPHDAVPGDATDLAAAPDCEQSIVGVWNVNNAGAQIQFAFEPGGTGHVLERDGADVVFSGGPIGFAYSMNVLRLWSTASMGIWWGCSGTPAYTLAWSADCGSATVVAAQHDCFSLLGPDGGRATVFERVP